MQPITNIFTDLIFKEDNQEIESLFSDISPKYFPGPLCKRDHSFKGLPLSLRTIHVTHECIICAAIVNERYYSNTWRVKHFPNAQPYQRKRSKYLSESNQKKSPSLSTRAPRHEQEQ